MEFGPVNASTMATVSVFPPVELPPVLLELHAARVSVNATRSASALA
jgi:hypothetical protein